MALKTSLVITGDSASAVGALSDIEHGFEKAGAAGVRTGAQLSRAANDVTQAAQRQTFAIRNAGQQVGDFGLQVATGQDPARAFSQQIGQLGYAMSEMGGKAGKVGAFLTGPWGIALTIGAAIAAPFIEKLFDAGANADDMATKLGTAAAAADSFGNAQTLVGKIVELTTGKLKTQNVVLVEYIKLAAQANIVAAQKDQRTASDALKAKASPNLIESVAGSFAGLGTVDTFGGGAVVRRLNGQREALKPLKAAVDDYVGSINRIDLSRLGQLKSGELDGVATRIGTLTSATIAQLDKLGASGKLAGRDLIDTKRAVLDLGKTLQDQVANQLAVNAADGKGVGALLTPFKAPGKPKAAPKAKSTEGRDEFGRDTADRIASITAAFDGTPRLVDQIDAKVRQLDDLIDDLGRKKPPNFKTLIEDAERAKIVVSDGLIDAVAKAFEKPKTLGEKAAAAVADLDAEIAKLAQHKPPSFQQLIDQAVEAKAAIDDSLNKPIEEFIDRQGESLRIGELVLANRRDEAEALRVVLDLQRQGLTVSAEQREAILAGVRAQDNQARAQEKLNRRQQNLTGLTSDVRGSLTDALAGRSTDLAGAILDSFRRAFAEQVAQRFIDPVIDSINSKILGTTGAQAPADKFSAAVNTTLNPLASFADAVGQAAAAAQAAGGPVTAGSSIADLTDASTISVIGNPITDAASITSVEASITSLFDDLTAPLFSVLGTPINATINGEDAKAFGKAAGPSLGGAISNVLGPQLSGALGGLVGGALTGLSVAGVAGSLGVKLNTGGAALGGLAGAGGALLGGLSLGGPAGIAVAIAGSVLGGVLGNVFAIKPRGVAQITDATSKPLIGGNNDSAKSDAKGAAGAVQSGLKQIVQTLGGQLDKFNVSIGTFDGKYRVSTTGFGGSLDFKAAKNQGLVDFGKDGQAEAISFAIADAIKDGAVKGLSAAVQQALRSSSDLNDALTEATKTQNLELLLGGVGAQLQKEFKSFEANAADRLRIAKTYGFDIVKVEELNAKERLSLSKQLLADQVGSLQDLIDQITSGSLFEGSAVDKRTALLDQIGAAKADADAGVAGAADKLSSLYEQLNATSKDVFATTGGFAADQQAILDGARDVIVRANQRVADAQKATDPALVETNAQLNESNDQLARLVTYMGDSVGYLSTIAQFAGVIDLSSVKQAAAY